jgi:hypothetical protein
MRHWTTNPSGIEMEKLTVLTLSSPAEEGKPSSFS